MTGKESMTEEAISDELQNQNQEEIQQPALSESVVTPEAPAEKMLTQSEVDRIAARLKREAYEKGIRDGRLQGEQVNQSSGNPEEDNLNRAVDQRVEHLANVRRGKEIAKDFMSKIQAAKEKHPEIENMVDELQLVSEEYAHLIPWLNGMDNTADAIADLHDNPTKYADIVRLAKDLPHLLPKQMHKLSVSLKKNAEAKKIPIPNEPLSQIKPGMGKTDSGEMKVRDLRKQDWARG